MPLFADLSVRCRICSPCLNFRRKVWTNRARIECSHSQRTWFVTLTLRPDRHFYYLELARHMAKKRGVDFDSLNDNDKFRYRCKSIGAELTLTLKRLRKKTAANIRYLFVFEAHESGSPHIHGLIHEGVGSNEIRKAVFQGEWHEGFSHCKLIDVGDTRAVHYVCKYLAKDNRTRVRASLHYGNTKFFTQRAVKDLHTFSNIVHPIGEREQMTPNVATSTIGAND